MQPEPKWSVAADVLEGNLGPWIPLGERCLVRGKLKEDRPMLVDQGARVFLDMSQGETRKWVGGKLRRQLRRPGVLEELEGEGFEIKEDLTLQDIELLNSRDKPRIAHTFTGTSSVPSLKKEESLVETFAHSEATSSTKERTPTPPLPLPTAGPLKSKIIERNPSPDIKPVDPASKILGQEMRKSFFRRMRQREETNEEGEKDDF